MQKHIQVAVGVILKDNAIFITKRPDNLHQGGKWEFPGGKIEANESVEQALARELFEEIGIVPLRCSALMDIHHDYGDKKVSLRVLTVARFEGQPYGKEGQQGRWVAIENLADFEFPAANVEILEKIQQQYL
ncbi:8-oxo-dGTP diphosphatase MutT [Alteromonadaceae bacterium BrNp21-10]|nr:8-oxo-dGTP diphosphatase MutT [Alteromonadaceae bacterium BrNp21-10]